MSARKLNLAQPTRADRFSPSAFTVSENAARREAVSGCGAFRHDNLNHNDRYGHAAGDLAIRAVVLAFAA